MLAQNMIKEAYHIEKHEKRIKLAQEALDISENCADAYILLAFELPMDDIEGRKALFERAIHAGKKIIGEENFDKYKGNF